MKKILFVIVIVALFLALVAESKEILSDRAEASNKTEISKESHSIQWYDNVEKALLKSKETGHPVFIHFTGSDWCGWCIRLKDEVYDHTPFIDYTNNNWIMVKLDYPSEKVYQSEETKAYNMEKLKQYGIKGFPTVVLLNSTGKEIGRTGYREGGPDVYIKHLEEFIN